MKLRDNQQECVNVMYSKFTAKKYKPGIVVAPTAYGKSHIVGALSILLDGKVMVLQPSKELLLQNFEKFKGYGGDGTIYSASAKSKDHTGQVVFATLGTVVNKLELFADVKYIIVDECHLYPPTSESMFGKLLKAIPDARLCGLTATPFRLKYDRGRGARLSMLGSARPSVFKDFWYICQIQDIAEKYWTRLRYHFVDVNLTGLVETSTGSDYTDDSVKRVGEKMTVSILEILERTTKKHIICFCSSVEQAVNLSAIVPNSGVVSAYTPDAERKQLVEDFRSGKIRVMFNMNVFSTGFDYPEIDMVILARPTLSLQMVYQQIGRGTRIFPGKMICEVVDMSGVIKRFGYIEELRIIKKEADRTYKLYSGEKVISGTALSSITSDVFMDMELSFGIHKGKKISQLPKDYRAYIKQNTNNQLLKKNISQFERYHC